MRIDRPVGWLLAVAAVLRLAWALVVPVRPVSDGAAYETFARNLAAGGAFGWDPAVPDAYWAPGPAFLYSLFLRAFGPDLWPIVIGNGLLSMAAVVLTVVVVRQWSSERVALAAGWLMACWPLQIQFVTILASELPFTVAVLAAFAFAGRGTENWPRVLAAGVMIAVASYLRPTALLLPGGLALVALWRRTPWVPVLTRTAAIVAVTVVLVAPWTYRNYQVFGRFVAISANSGANLWMGNNPDSDGTYMPTPPELASLDRASKDALLRERAIEWMTQEPAAAAALMVRKLAVTHATETIGVVWNIDGLAERGVGERGRFVLSGISTLYWIAALVLALGGFVVAVRRNGLGSVPVVMWIYFAAVHAITVAMDRYHIPSIPFVAWLAALALVDVEARVKAWRSRPQP